jgi:glycosyltransferase involved in cell wall biosynthesis
MLGTLPKDEGVEVVGEVASASEFLQGLSVLVYPIERGSGMKVKVLESIASGLPVVTTSAGAEGIDGGSGVVIESTAEALAASTVRILRDQDERRERGRAARETFLRLYSPVPATAPLVKLYRRMACQ